MVDNESTNFGGTRAVKTDTSQITRVGWQNKISVSCWENAMSILGSTPNCKPIGAIAASAAAWLFTSFETKNSTMA